jgi:serine/threonine protein kinase
MTRLTQSGAILGTPAWMSPEQAAGQTDSIDVATDVYSLGAVLFAMLTGRPPFQAASPLDTVLMVLEQDPPNIRMLNRAVDSDLEMVVMKCLQKPQDLRYSSAAALASDMRAWLNNEPVSARYIDGRAGDDAAVSRITSCGDSAELGVAVDVA